jgi:hypothetical protein
MCTMTRDSASGDPTQKTQELIQATKFIQAAALWIDNFEDTKLSMNDELINNIEFFVNTATADIIYTHLHRCTDHDHRAVAEVTIEAGRYVPNILSYDIAGTKDFKPQMYYDLSDVIDDKIQLIDVFWSQKEKMFIKSNTIRGLAQYRALQNKLNTSIMCIEALEVLKLSLEKGFKILTTERYEKNIPCNTHADYIGEQVIECSDDDA